MMNKEEIKIDGIPIQDYGTPNSRTCYSSNYTSKEEQEAIKWVNKNKDIFPFNALLNYITKLQKENEELKEMLKTRIRYTNELEQDLFENASNYVVSKDKIKDKIEELEEQCKTELLTTWLEAKIEVLEELLKENKI